MLLDRFVYKWFGSYKSCDIHRPAAVSSFTLCSRWPNSSCIHGHSSTISPKIILQRHHPPKRSSMSLPSTDKYVTSFHPIDISDIVIKTLSDVELAVGEDTQDTRHNLTTSSLFFVEWNQILSIHPIHTTGYRARFLLTGIDVRCC